MPTAEDVRAEVKAWLEENWDPDLTVAEWWDRLARAGYAAPTFPEDAWGKGWGRDLAMVVSSALAEHGAIGPPAGLGVLLAAPTIAAHGNERQKQEDLLRILNGQDAWCQLFSEPGAGSDLASLQCKAEDKGDHFVINGQKIWTSGAQYADWCFCLVRTDTSKKHEGISFVLFTMHQPGVEVRPIPLIAGNSPFCETFFTDAIADKKNLVGPLNGGWTIAKRLLQHERSGLSGAGGGGMFGAAKSLDALAKDYVGLDATGRIADSDLRTRIVNNAIDARAFQQTAVRAMMEAKGNSGPSAATSIMKNAGTRVMQDRAELTLEIMGSQGLGWEGEGFSAEELAAVRGWLGGKAVTIYGGSFEVQNNIISKRILGLPDLTQNH